MDRFAAQTGQAGHARFQDDGEREIKGVKWQITGHVGHQNGHDVIVLGNMVAGRSAN